MIEKKAAETLLDNPVNIRVDIKPKNAVHKFLQWASIKPKQALFKITGATLRTMVRISKLYLELEVKPLPNDAEFLDFAYKSVQKDAYKLAQVIATAIHNNKSEVPESLVNMVFDNMTANELNTISRIVVDRLNLIDFINTIASVRNTVLTEASPMEREELIAPYGQL